MNSFREENSDIVYEDYVNMIYSIAMKNRVKGMETEDLNQELSMKYIKCVDKFDKSKGVMFSTYLYGSLIRHVIRLRQTAKKKWERLDEVLTLNRTTGDNDTEMMDLNECETDVEEDVINKDILMKSIEILKGREYGYITLDRYLDNKSMTNIAKDSNFSGVKCYTEHENNLEAIRDELGIELCKKVLEAGLTDTEKKIYDFRITGFTNTQIAERIGMSVKNVENTFYRARKKMKRGKQYE